MIVFPCLIAMTFLTSVNSNCYWGYHPDTYPRNVSTYAVYEKVIPNNAVQQDFESGCEAVTLFFIGRNNIKYPSSELIEKMKDELPMLKDAILRASGTLCLEDKQALSEWTMGFDDRLADQFTEPGYRSARELGDRFKYRFPSLFHSSGGDDSDIVFAHVYSNETYNSAVAFAQGAFNNTALVTDGFDISNLDSRLLNFGSVCDAQSDRDDVEEELEDFIEEQIVQDMISRMASRLGLSDDVLSFKNIDLMYKVCALESSLYARSPWCSVFSWEDSAIMDFKEDMVTHQLYGPSDGISEDQTCMLMKDFVDKVDNPSAISSMPRGVFYFAAADAILPFISKLGLFPDDEDLESDSLSDMDENVAGRKWRMSRVNPLGSNVAIVLYRCGDELSLKVLLNEQEQVIPPCQSSLCPIKTLLGDIENFADDCDFDDICDGAISQTLARGSLLLSAGLVLAATLSTMR